MIVPAISRSRDSFRLMMKRVAIRIMPLLLALACSSETTAVAASGSEEPDYSAWREILRDYYDPARGMNYAALKQRDAAKLRALQKHLARVDVDALSRNAKLAYWMNLYNVGTVATVVEHYPVESIRDISTDPIVRLNVFKKDRVPFGDRKVSLDWIEHENVRKFGDPRIHFSINCAAKSCPPMPTEPFTGANVDRLLDEQTRRFLNGPGGVELARRGDTLIVRTTKIADWFSEDFEKAGGVVPFLQRHLEPAKRNVIAQAKTVRLDWFDYDWALNDWKR